MSNLNLFPVKVVTENSTPSSGKKSCGECTRCCEGYLEGEAYGYKFYNGKACHFLSNNKCSIYENRPADPCVKYKCHWLINEDMPDYMRPDKSNVLMTQRNFNGIDYLSATETGKKIDSEILSDLIQYCFSNNINLEYQVNGKFCHLGSKDFVDKATLEIKRKLSNI